MTFGESWKGRPDLDSTVYEGSHARMGQLSAEQLMQAALELELLSERQFQEIWAAVGSMASLEDVKKQILRGEYMTNFQLERLAKGERAGFFYGPYKVLYNVGAGTFARLPRRAQADGRDRCRQGSSRTLVQAR